MWMYCWYGVGSSLIVIINRLHGNTDRHDLLEVQPLDDRINIRDVLEFSGPCVAAKVSEVKPIGISDVSAFSRFKSKVHCGLHYQKGTSGLNNSEA